MSPAWESCPAYLEVKYCSRDKIGLYFYLEKNTGVEREPSPGRVTLGLVCLRESAWSLPAPTPISTLLWLPRSGCVLSAILAGLSLDSMVLLEKSVLFSLPFPSLAPSGAPVATHG